MVPAILCPCGVKTGSERDLNSGKEIKI